MESMESHKTGFPPFPHLLEIPAGIPTLQTGQNLADRTLKDGSVTFEWFVRNRYFPQRKGDWRPGTAKEKMAQIEIDLIAKFGEYPLDSFDGFTLQTHVNDFALRYSQDRVKHARSYLKSIFDEAIEQEFLVKDPTRKLKIPKNLRPKDKRILRWDQMWMILTETARRDRLLLMLDMTEALRPSELFALRWRSFDDQNTLTISETVYRRTIRPFGKTPGSLSKVHLPSGLAAELRRWKLECKSRSPEAFIFPNADGGLPDSVQEIVGSMYAMLQKGEDAKKGVLHLLPNATDAPKEQSPSN
jgi:integrase